MSMDQGPYVAQQQYTTSPPVPKANVYRPLPDDLPYTPEPSLLPTVASMLHFFVTFPTDDPTKSMCSCGCNVYDEVNTAINDLCHGLYIQSDWDYAKYYHLTQACIRIMTEMKTPPAARTGFLIHARNLGVTHFAWAVVDAQCASQSIAAVLSAFADNNFGSCKSIISMGAGNGYVEYVFDKVIKKQYPGLQMVAYDSFPSATPYLPVQNGTPQNICSDVLSAQDCCLMLCWPPLGTPLSDGSYNPNPDPNKPSNTMASDALKNYAAKGGRTLLYIGERTLYGCTGDPKFHELLEDYWTLVNSDQNGNSTVPLLKWCPQPTSVPTGYTPKEYQIAGVSGNDNVWVYVLKDPTPFKYQEKYAINNPPRQLPPPLPGVQQQQSQQPPTMGQQQYMNQPYLQQTPPAPPVQHGGSGGIQHQSQDIPQPHYQQQNVGTYTAPQGAFYHNGPPAWNGNATGGRGVGRGGGRYAGPKPTNNIRNKRKY